MWWSLRWPELQHCSLYLFPQWDSLMFKLRACLYFADNFIFLAPSACWYPAHVRPVWANINSSPGAKERRVLSNSYMKPYNDQQSHWLVSQALISFWKENVIREARLVWNIDFNATWSWQGYLSNIFIQTVQSINRLSAPGETISISIL